MRLSNPFRKVFGMSKRDHGQIPEPPADPEVVHKHFPHVNFVHQNHVNLCGDACAAMLLLHHKKEVPYPIARAPRHDDVWLMQRNPRGVVRGANTDHLARACADTSLHVYNIYPFPLGEWNAKSVARLLDVFGPFMASLVSRVAGHWILVIGVLNDRLYFHDPWRGRNMSMTMEEFQRKNDGKSEATSVAVSEAPIGGFYEEFAYFSYKYDAP